jgi:hypothetical protein
MKRRGPLFIALKPDEIGWGWKTIGWEFEAALQLETT